MDVTSALLVTLFILVASLYFRRHSPKLPPCPVAPLPILGHLLHFGANPRPQFRKWRENAGDIFSLYLGQTLVVVINGYDLIREALQKKGECCSDRPYIFFDAAVGKPGLGIIFSSGETWREHRTLTVNILKALGMNSNVTARRVGDVVAVNNDVISGLKGQPTDLSPILLISVTNIICSMIMGKCFDHNDREFLHYCELYCQNIAEASPKNMANYFQFLPYLPGDIFGAKRIKARAEKIMTDFVEPYIRKASEEELDETDLDNFISRYLLEMKKKQKKGEPTTLSNDNLKKMVYDLLGAGMDTVLTTLRWGILYLLKYPDIQSRVYKEIEDVVGTERLPSMNDKSQLPYLNAFILETQRTGSVVPLNVNHFCNEELTIGGYTLPKGTQIMSPLDSILLDTKIWGKDADEFRPDRFLDEKGKLVYPDQHVAFSLGKRACAGEALAKVELFIFFSWMVQKFHFMPEAPGLLPSTDVEFGFTACPHPYKVRAIDRKSV